jgi:arylsulfatase A-like enzyme
MFLFAGPGVRRAGRLARADIVDVLPTLLTLAGLPVPLGLDGRPIAAALAREPGYTGDGVDWNVPTRVELGDEGEADMAARLRALGYLEPRE